MFQMLTFVLLYLKLTVLFIKFAHVYKQTNDTQVVICKTEFFILGNKL